MLVDEGEVVMVMWHGQISRPLEPDSPALLATPNDCARKHQQGIEIRGRSDHDSSED